jgi:hypothetical protein
VATLAVEGYLAPPPKAKAMDGQNELLAAVEAMKPLMESLGADKVKTDTTELETAIKSLRASVRRHRSTLRSCLWPCGGWIGSDAAAPFR